MMIGSRDGLGILMPIQLNDAAAAEMVATSGGGGGSPPMRAAKEERLPQWSRQETMNFIAIRGELERDFNVSKRNKMLWEVVAARTRERGHRRSPDQCKCKWKNLVNRYRKFNTERSRNVQRLLESETGTLNHLGKKLKRSSGNKSLDELSEYEDDDSDDDHRLARSRKKRTGKVQHQHQHQRGSDKPNNNIHELLQDFFQQQRHNEAQWRDSAERRAQERWCLSRSGGKRWRSWRGRG